MTAYLALRDLPLRRRLTAPDYRAQPGESLLGLEPGERDTVHDLLYGLLLPSGNDAAVTLADGVAGSVGAFVAKMNAAARRLGLDHTHYATPVGLDAPGNYSTATDLARLATILLHDPRFARIVDTPRATLRSGAVVRHVVNRNDLLDRVPWIDGVKTGYTSAAGNVLVASGRRHGVDLVSVTLGAPTETARDDDTLALLRYGFSLYEPRRVVSAGETLARPRVRYEGGRVPLLAAHDVRRWVRPREPIAVRPDVPAAISGPIRRGRRVGSARVADGSDELAEVPLVTSRSVPPPTVAGGLEDALPASPSRAVAGAVGLALLAAGLGLAAALAAPSSRRGRLRGRRMGAA